MLNEKEPNMDLTPLSQPTQSHKNEENSEGEQNINWTSWPLMDRPLTSVFVILFLFFITFILYQLTIQVWEQPLYYLLGIFILLIGIMPYLVPTTYTFYKNHVLIQYPLIKRERAYSEFGCFYVDKMGIMLSTFKQPRRLDAFRGQSIRFSKTKEEKEIIIELLKEKIGKQF